MSGLSLLSQELDTKLQRATSAKQRAASLVACQFALAKAGVEVPVVATALAELRAGRVFPPNLKAQLDSLAEQLDEQYFDLKDAAEAGTTDPKQWQDMFAKARAVTALSNAGDEDAYKAAGESIYEAAFSLQDDNKQELLALVEAVLE
jgi:predicted transcriptional regulator